MLKNILKIILIAGMAVINYGTTQTTADSTMPPPEYPGMRVLFSACAILIYVMFAYRLWTGLKGWPWILALNIVLCMIAIMLGSPQPGP